jgi:hypothetical protein
MELQSQFKAALNAFLNRLQRHRLANWTITEASLVQRPENGELHWFACFLIPGERVTLTALDSLPPNFPVRTGLLERKDNPKQLIAVISHTPTLSWLTTVRLPQELEVSEILSPVVYAVQMPRAVGEAT